MQLHLDGSATTLAMCWRLTRSDGQMFRFTTVDVDVTVDLGDGTGAQTYLASSAFGRSAIKSNDTYGVDNLEVQGILDSAIIDEEELRRGLFDRATVEVFLVNYGNLADGVIRLRKGTLGEVILTKRNFFLSELRGLSQFFQTRIGERYVATCNADLGDSRCRIPLLPDAVARDTAYEVGDFVRVVTATTPDGTWFDHEGIIYRCTTAGTSATVEPTYDTVPGNTTTDGTAVFTAEDSFTRALEVSAVAPGSPQKQFTTTSLSPGITPRTLQPTGWFDFGAVVWETGNNAGVAMEVRTFTQNTASQDVRLFLDLPKNIVVGDRARIYPGCDLLRSTCINKFDNILNFRGFPDIPGQDAALDYPDAKL
jgi:uncharacterized phage protein (TIGR02218 family)